MTGVPIDLVYRQHPSAVRSILESLPEWFGDPTAIDGYEQDGTSNAFQSVLALDGGETVGVALVRRHFRASAELHLIAVDPDMRGRGVGQALVERICTDLSRDRCHLLSVHTVGPSFDSEPYAATRRFYESAGFHPLEEHSGLDWSGPSLILVKVLDTAVRQ